MCWYGACMFPGAARVRGTVKWVTTPGAYGESDELGGTSSVTVSVGDATSAVSEGVSVELCGDGGRKTREESVVTRNSGRREAGFCALDMSCAVGRVSMPASLAEGEDAARTSFCKVGRRLGRRHDRSIGSRGSNAGENLEANRPTLSRTRAT